VSHRSISQSVTPITSTRTHFHQHCWVYSPTSLRYQNFSSSQSQSHIATDVQSARPSWYRAPSGTHDQMLSHKSDLYSMSRPVASSLMRGRVCHLSFVLVLVKNCNIFTVQIYTIHKTNYKQYIHGLCQFRQCAADYAFLITYYAVTAV
jgi:hypothetical protein